VGARRLWSGCPNLGPALTVSPGDFPPGPGYRGTRTVSILARSYLPSCVPPSLDAGGNGIYTVCPSPTPCGLGLGPPNPERMNLPQETLGFRRPGFSPGLYATHTGILTSARSSRPSGRPSLPAERSPTISPCSREQANIHGFGAALPSPATLSAPGHLTSELLRTLSMVAASKPTSWLSVHPDILSH
jgi:hypothetical protein